MRIFRTFVLAPIFTAVFLIAANEPLSARAVRVYTEEELLEQSTLVVIATPTANRAAKDMELFGADRFPCVDTTFKVLSVIKGARSIKSVILHHFGEGASAVPNGADLVEFNPAGKKKFRLCLRRLADGRYAPTSGYPDIGMSVLEETRK